MWVNGHTVTPWGLGVGFGRVRELRSDRSRRLLIMESSKILLIYSIIYTDRVKVTNYLRATVTTLERGEGVKETTI